LDFIVVRLADCDGWDTLEWLLELVCHFSHLLEVFAAFGGVGASHDRLDVLHLNGGGATLGERCIRLVWEDSSHQAVDELESEGLASVFILERVDLNVVDGTGLDLVAVALHRRERNKRLLRHRSA
jgi:hypothetical protein